MSNEIQIEFPKSNVVEDKTKLVVSAKTEAVIAKLESGSIDQVSTQELKIISRTAENKRRVEKLQRGY